MFKCNSHSNSHPFVHEKLTATFLPLEMMASHYCHSSESFFVTLHDTLLSTARGRTPPFARQVKAGHHVFSPSRRPAPTFYLLPQTVASHHVYCPVGGRPLPFTTDSGRLSHLFPSRQPASTFYHSIWRIKWPAIKVFHRNSNGHSPFATV